MLFVLFFDRTWAVRCNPEHDGLIAVSFSLSLSLSHHNYASTHIPVYTLEFLKAAFTHKFTQEFF